MEKDRVERFLNGLRMSLEKDLSLFMLPTHAEALDKALKAEWMREMVNADSKAGEKKRPPQSNRSGEKKGHWGNKKNPKYKTGCERCGPTMMSRNARGQRELVSVVAKSVI